MGQHYAEGTRYPTADGTWWTDPCRNHSIYFPEVKLPFYKKWFGILFFYLGKWIMVVFSPFAYPGYDWLSMAVSDLSAEGAPSAELASQLNALFGPCGLVSIMAVCVSVAACKSKVLKTGVYFFTAMEWICNVGYNLFPWVSDAPISNPQNVMHLVVTVLVVVLSLASLVLIAIGAKKMLFAGSVRIVGRNYSGKDVCK